MSEIGAQSGVRNLRIVGEEEAGSEDLVGEYLLTLEGGSAPTVEVSAVRSRGTRSSTLS